jgi:hypothetical protein
MASAGALGRHPLGVDFRRPAAGLGSFTLLPFLEEDGPSGRRQLFLFCSFGNTERPVKILFF